MAETDSNEPDGAAENRKRRKLATVLVSVPGWPSQDPGRLMIWTVRPSPQKAARMVKRLTRLMPEYSWSYEMLTTTEAREVKLRPFTVTDTFSGPVLCRWTGRTWKLQRVKPDAS